MRKLSTLRGLATLAVVVIHAISYAIFALTSWGFKFGVNTPGPNRAWIGEPGYYTLLLVGQVAFSSVPIFLFISGCFVAYAARGKPASLNWRVSRGPTKQLQPPHLQWLIMWLDR